MLENMYNVFGRNNDHDTIYLTDDNNIRMEFFFISTQHNNAFEFLTFVHTTIILYCVS